MIAYPIGLSTGCFYKQSLLEVLVPIRDSGFTILEISASPSHLDFHDLPQVRTAAARIAELGITVHSYHAPFGQHLDITSPDEILREASVEEILFSVEAAVTLGARYFTLHPGPDKNHLARKEEIEQRRASGLGSLDRIAASCRERGVELLLENMLPYHLFGRISDLLWFREAAAEGSLGLCLDTGHANLAGDLYMTAQRVAEHVRIIHAHDNLYADDHLPPGKGRIDWQRLMEVLAASGFDGMIMLELSGEHEGDPESFLEEARRASELIEDLFLHLA
ncbi:MAG: sugar phosphate isomerase/epimerase [Desulfobacteraceae bacterium]|nr:sugar phosphate isomerase/epimerase [Desulfobacteraceae bacterium]